MKSRRDELYDEIDKMTADQLIKEAKKEARELERISKIKTTSEHTVGNLSYRIIVRCNEVGRRVSRVEERMRKVLFQRYDEKTKKQ